MFHITADLGGPLSLMSLVSPFVSSLPLCSCNFRMRFDREGFSKSQSMTNSQEQGRVVLQSMDSGHTAGFKPWLSQLIAV